MLNGGNVDHISLFHSEHCGKLLTGIIFLILPAILCSRSYFPRLLMEQAERLNNCQNSIVYTY